MLFPKQHPRPPVVQDFFLGSIDTQGFMQIIFLMVSRTKMEENLMMLLFLMETNTTQSKQDLLLNISTEINSL